MNGNGEVLPSSGDAHTMAKTLLNLKTSMSGEGMNTVLEGALAGRLRPNRRPHRRQRHGKIALLETAVGLLPLEKGRLSTGKWRSPMPKVDVVIARGGHGAAEKRHGGW